MGKLQDIGGKLQDLNENDPKMSVALAIVAIVGILLAGFLLNLVGDGLLLEEESVSTSLEGLSDDEAEALVAAIDIWAEEQGLGTYELIDVNIDDDVITAQVDISGSTLVAVHDDGSWEMTYEGEVTTIDDETVMTYLAASGSASDEALDTDDSASDEDGTATSGEASETSSSTSSDVVEISDYTVSPKEYMGDLSSVEMNNIVRGLKLWLDEMGIEDPKAYTLTSEAYCAYDEYTATFSVMGHELTIGYTGAIWEIACDDETLSTYYTEDDMYVFEECEYVLISDTASIASYVGETAAQGIYDLWMSYASEQDITDADQASIIMDPAVTETSGAATLTIVTNDGNEYELSLMANRTDMYMVE